MSKWLMGIILVLLVVVAVEWKQVQYANSKWETAEANVKAYDSQLSYERKKVYAFQLTVDQMKYFNDSVLKDLEDTRKELGIKDKNLKALQQVSSSFSKKDTVVFRDTLFKDTQVHIDTLLGDGWYSLKLGLHYPSMIAVKPYFKSEKHIVVSTKKETVNPPKKFFLFRWFQKKHRILHVDVVEKNPYVDNEVSKYVEIIK